MKRSSVFHDGSPAQASPGANALSRTTRSLDTSKTIELDTQAKASPSANALSPTTRSLKTKKTMEPDTFKRTSRKTMDPDTFKHMSSGRKKKGRKKKEWRAVKDPTSGRTYFYNDNTKETTWVKPAAM